MSQMETNIMDDATKQYIATLENVLAAAIVDMYTTHTEACVATFTRPELMAALHQVQALPEDAAVEQLYADALRHPCCNILK